jgi:hypothetical protein
MELIEHHKHSTPICILLLGGISRVIYDPNLKEERSKVVGL